MAGWGPTVDGNVLPHHPFDPSAPMESADVPFLTGTNLNEFHSGLDHGDAVTMTEGELSRKVRAEFGDKGDAIIEAYRREYPHETPFGIYAAMAAAPFRWPAVEQAAPEDDLFRPGILHGARLRRTYLRDLLLLQSAAGVLLTVLLFGP